MCFGIEINDEYWKDFIYPIKLTQSIEDKMIPENNDRPTELELNKEEWTAIKEINDIKGPSKKNPNCQGTVFRAQVHHYAMKRGYGFQVRLHIVKSLSCWGCRFCKWEDDLMLPIENIEKAEHGKLYTINCIVDSIGKTGTVDKWHGRLAGPWDERTFRN